MKKVIRLTESQLVDLVKKVINEDMGSVDFDEYGIEKLNKAGFKKISNGKYVKGKYKVVIYTKGCGEKYPGFTCFKDDKAIYQGCPDDCWVWWKENVSNLK